MPHPPIEYHLRIETSEGAHGDSAAETPFPAISVGDIVSAEGFVSGGTMGIPGDVEMRVSSVQHEFWYLEKVNALHVTTVLFTELQPRRKAT